MIELTEGARYTLTNGDGTAYYGTAYKGSPMTYRGRGVGGSLRFDRHDVARSVHVAPEAVASGAVVVAVFGPAAGDRTERRIFRDDRDEADADRIAVQLDKQYKFPPSAWLHRAAVVDGVAGVGAAVGIDARDTDVLPVAVGWATPTSAAGMFWLGRDAAVALAEALTAAVATLDAKLAEAARR